MAKSYRPVVRDQQYLMPENMRDWLPDNHVVWFVIDVIEQADMSVFEGRRRRRSTATSTAGQRGYDPSMLAALLIYAYCVGIPSSRRIEQLCRTDVAFRIACAGDVPDHTVIARFRKDHHAAFADLFAQVLGLCAQAGMVKVGVVAIDGTTIAANASINKNKTEATIRSMVDKLVAEAEETDAAEDLADEPDGMSAPPGLGTGAARRAYLKGLLDRIEGDKADLPITPHDNAIRRLEDAEARLSTITDEVTERHQRYEADLAAGTPVAGNKRLPPEQHSHVHRARERVERAHKRVVDYGPGGAKEASGGIRKNLRCNLTDPDSRMRKTRKGYVQGYNAQLAVSEDHIIVAAHIVDGLDVGAFKFMLERIDAALTRLNAEACDQHVRTVGTAVADAGYLSVQNLQCEGPDRLIATGRAHAVDKRATVGTIEHTAAQQHPKKYREPDIVAMEQRLQQPDDLATYRRRQAIVEPVNGHLKDRRNLRQFALRGAAAVQGELHLAALATNLMRLFTTTNAATA
jgi:transposase